MILAGIIVAYNPNHIDLVSNIESYIAELDCLFIYKNSKITIEDALFIKYGEKVIFLGSENNDGVGMALNEGVSLAKKKGFTHLLTLDQDSYFKNGHLANFRKIIEFDMSPISKGIYIPNLVYREKLLITGQDKPCNVLDGITSGSIFPISLFDIVGGFNNFLFIDGVDFEFCYRIRSKYGFNTILFPNVHLVHQLGYSTKSLLGFTTINYNSFRTFFLVRNHILLWKKYPKLYRFEYKKALIKEYIIYRIVKVLLSEKDKLSKIKSICNGIYHGLSNKL
jgi:rhamnosyltransferase